MKQTFLRTIVLVILSLGLAATASAKDYGVCPALEGAWGYTETGTVMVPSADGSMVSVIAVAVGKYDFDLAGTFSGTQYSSAGGTVVADTKVGTYTLNPDCTGTMTIKIYDSSGTTLRRTSVWAIVIDDKATEIRGIMTSMVLPNGVALSPIMTVTAKKMFPVGH